MASFQGLFTRSRGPRPPPFVNDVSLTHREDARPEARADPYYPPTSTFILPNTSVAHTTMNLQEVYRNNGRSELAEEATPPPYRAPIQSALSPPPVS